jgi:hypothetical protein
MKSEISLPISTQQFLSLADFLKFSGSDKDPVAVVAEAIDYWMENAGWKQDVLMPEALKNSDKGYHWKDVFLPNGTSIRMKYKGDFYYAAVQGDNIIYESQSVSPSEFANTVTQSNRNAWNDIWIKRPNDTEWIFADTIRRKKAA